MPNELIVTFSPRNGTVAISDSILRAMGNPSEIHTMFNYDDNLFLICPKNDNARPYIKVPEKRSRALEVPNECLVRRLYIFENWNKWQSMSVAGHHLPKTNGILFSLDTAFRAAD